jgi:hypothetical protein
MHLLSCTQTYFAAATLSCMMRNILVWEDSSSVHCSKCFSLSSTHDSYRYTKIENLIPLRYSLKSGISSDVWAESYNYNVKGVSNSGSYSPALTMEVRVQSQTSSCIFVGERGTQERILVLSFRCRMSCLSSINLFVFGGTVPSGLGVLIHKVSRSHTISTTVGRTSLDEWSARRRDLYLTTHITHNRQISMLPVEFEPIIWEGERPQTYVLDRAATETGSSIN